MFELLLGEPFTEMGAVVLVIERLREATRSEIAIDVFARQLQRGAEAESADVSGSQTARSGTPGEAGTNSHRGQRMMSLWTRM